MSPAPAPKLSDRLKISLDELRMQVLGAQVLLGFQFQSLFQDGFEVAGAQEHGADALALAATLIAFAMLIAAPVQHRLVHEGEATRSLLEFSTRCAELALAAQAFAIGCIGFTIARHLGVPMPMLAGIGAFAMAALGWFGLGAWVRHVPRPELPEREMTDLHVRINQMLTEARVILPGVQAMLGFQLIVVMTRAFEKLPRALQWLHLGGLAAAVVCITLLIAPAAVHRLAFHGNDDSRFHQIGTRLLNIALLPLALALAAESFIASWKLAENNALATVAAGGVLLVLMGTWYVLPLAIRQRQAS
jgi:hypothetical protein